MTIKQAQAALDEAAKAMAAAVREEFPVEATVTTAAWGPDFVARVTNYGGCDPCACGFVYVRGKAGWPQAIHYSQLRKVEPKEKT